MVAGGGIFVFKLTALVCIPDLFLSLQVVGGFRQSRRAAALPLVMVMLL
jgi:hypothetical protein